MRNGNNEQRTVDQVLARVPEAAHTLREYRIDPTSRMSLRTAAAAASVEVDELLAVMEARARRAARRAAAKPAPAHHTFDEFEHEEAFELLAA